MEIKYATAENKNGKTTFSHYEQKNNTLYPTLRSQILFYDSKFKFAFKNKKRNGQTRFVDLVT